MDAVSSRAISKFKLKFDLNDPDAFDHVSRWAVGYKDAYLELAASVRTMLVCGSRGQEAVKILMENLDKSIEQVGDAARLIGNSSQALKSLRERVLYLPSYKSIFIFILSLSGVFREDR